MSNVFLSHSSLGGDFYSVLSDGFKDVGLNLWNVENLNAGNELRSEVLAAIRRADLFLAVMDDLNPNVLFELGYALGAGKNVLLLRSIGTKIPSDIASLPVETIDRFDLTTARKIAGLAQAIKPKNSPAKTYETPREMFQAFIDEPELADEYSSRQFEMKTADYFSDLGFKVDLLSCERIEGVDFDVVDEDSGLNILIEVIKRNKNSRVSVGDVQRIYGLTKESSAAGCIVVTTGNYTSSAKDFAESSSIPLLLLSLQDLLDLSKASILKTCVGIRESSAIGVIAKGIDEEIFDAVFQQMLKHFDPLHAGDITATFQFTIEGEGGGKWVFSISDGKCELKKGGISDPSVEILLSADTWLAIRSGALSSHEAFSGGKMKICGDFETALELRSLFQL